MENLNCRGIFFRVERIEGEDDLGERLRRRMSLPWLSHHQRAFHQPHRSLRLQSLQIGAATPTVTILFIHLSLSLFLSASSTQQRKPRSCLTTDTAQVNYIWPSAQSLIIKLYHLYTPFFAQIQYYTFIYALGLNVSGCFFLQPNKSFHVPHIFWKDYFTLSKNSELYFLNISKNIFDKFGFTILKIKKIIFKKIF